MHNPASNNKHSHRVELSEAYLTVFLKCHCTGVVYNGTAMLSRTFHQLEKQF